jgi:hypothetical protein
VSPAQSGVPIALVATSSLLLAPSSVFAKPAPPREECRAVSKVEYDSAKREYLLISGYV